ncbi:beta/gamma crystallin-related protein [Romboutsia sp.]|uniref:beta/gamma crystallin-related protein n=1 Tax=Romboutsia sp. TaxID=1965302 RepID=UPI002B6D884C|nr:beta/gamma crystallin-related protein [Romboutsia sp.]HSQ89767.1 beta/gamma crystallin-related protein [Romboutsia sp.]
MGKLVCVKSTWNDNYISINKEKNITEANSNTVCFSTKFNFIQVAKSIVILQSHDGYYIKADSSNGTLICNVIDKSEASLFTLIPINEKELYLKCDNGYYISVYDDKVLRAKESYKTDRCKFKIKELISKFREYNTVKIYELANYQGTVQELNVDSYNINQLNIDGSKLNSVKVSKGLIVTLYEHANFKGKSMTITVDTPCIEYYFNCKISSIKVENIIVKIYEYPNYQGKVQELQLGEYTSNQLSLCNNTLSSIKVPKGLIVILYKYDYFNTSVGYEQMVFIKQDTPLIEDSLNDKFSSIKVQTMTVKIYEDANYQGKVQELQLGEYNLNQLSIGYNTLSSIKVPVGFQVTLYEHADFEGKSKIITCDMPWVGSNFDNITSSIKVEVITVKIYEQPNYEGKVQELQLGQYNLNQLNIGNDTLSSIKIPLGFQVILYEHADFKGKSKVITYDTPLIGDGFDDITSSIRVELFQLMGF